MSYARASPAVAASNGKIYAIGGQLLIVMAIMMVMAMAVLMAIVNCDGNGIFYLRTLSCWQLYRDR